MSISPLRFLHAADIFLDSPLGRVAGFESADAPDVTEVIENAARIAFDRVIDEAVERQVDFVLLGGNTFLEAQRSLSARLALFDALDRLAEQDIRVFVAPGQADPPRAWRAIPDLPDNVTVFFDPESEPIAVLRDGKVIATVSAGCTIPAGPPANERPAQTLRSDAARRAPFSVFLLTRDGADGTAAPLDAAGGESSASLVEASTDYVALCSGTSRRTVTLKSGIAHHPGATQGMSPSQVGPRGCTLVEVESDGTIRCTFVPTAAVVWEQHSVDIDAETTEPELSARMRSAMSSRETGSGEPVRIVQWTLRGSGALWESLWDEASRRRFVERHHERCAGEPMGSVVHDFRLLTDAMSTGATTGGDSLAADFFEEIERHAKSPHEVLERCLEKAAICDPEWSARLRTLVPRLDHESLFAQARRMGMTWFGSAAGGGPAS